MQKKRNAGAVTRVQSSTQIQLELEFNAYRGLRLNSRGIASDMFEDAAALHEAEAEAHARSAGDLDHFQSLVGAWMAREVLV